jgi:hypothetical protein
MYSGLLALQLLIEQEKERAADAVTQNSTTEKSLGDQTKGKIKARSGSHFPEAVLKLIKGRRKKILEET